MAAAQLQLVPPSPTTEDLLREIVPDLAQAEEHVRRLRAHLAEQGRALAKSRGVAFIREEQLRREFGQ